MKIKTKASKYWVIKSVYLGFALCVVLIGAGCASTHKTTTTETTTAYSNSEPVGAGEEQDRPVVQKSETTAATTATTETKSGHPGLVSSTVHAIGWVISLPFRLIGGLIGWIF
jgi:hypothetical protein